MTYKRVPAAPMRRAKRHKQITDFIRETQLATAEQVAEHCNLSIHTAANHLAALSTARRIWFVRGKGYELARGVVRE